MATKKITPKDPSAEKVYEKTEAVRETKYFKIGRIKFGRKTMGRMHP